MNRLAFGTWAGFVLLSSACQQSKSSADGGRPGGGERILYVATTGNDSWSGTLPAPNAAATDGPFATIDHARVVVQGVDKSGLSRVTIQIRDGNYFLALTPPYHSLRFSSADSGTAETEIVYENYPNEHPVISGGIPVTGWTNRGSGNLWQTTLPAGTVPFENLYYRDERRLRPRIGGYLGADPSLRVFAEGACSADGALCPNDNTCPSFAPIAGTGGAGDAAVGSGATMYECFDRFQYCDPDPKKKNADTSCAKSPITNTWANLHNDPTCPVPQPANSDAPIGNIELLVFEQFSTSKLRIKCIDPTAGMIYLTGPTAFARQHLTESGFIDKHRYIIENVKDMLTLAGQWFLDESASAPSMTLTYLAKDNENPMVDSTTDAVIVPQLEEVLVASQLSFVTFRGLTFAHDNFRVDPQGYASTELEPSVSSAVSLQNSQHVVFDGNIVTETSGNGIEVISCNDDHATSLSPTWCADAPTPSAVTSDITVENSAFYEIGAAGVRVGEPGIPDADTNDNVPQLVTVQNNVIEGYGRVFPAAFGIGQGIGHDNLYTHNDVYDGYHCAISISENVPDNQKPGGDGAFNNTISFNHVHDLLQGIMNDGGSIRIENGNGVAIAAGNRILNNKVHDVTDASIQDADGYGGHGIYLDNQSGLIDVENNLVYRVSDATVYTPHGPQSSSVITGLDAGAALPDGGTGGSYASTIKNNILAYARRAMVEEGDPYQGELGASLANQAFVLTSNIFYFDLLPVQGDQFRIQGGCAWVPGFAMGTAPYGSYQQFDRNVYWRTDGALACDQKAFHAQNQIGDPSTDPNAPCSQDTTKWVFYPFQCSASDGAPTTDTAVAETCAPATSDAGSADCVSWQSLGEDTSSVVMDPWPGNPDPTTVDFKLPTVPASIGFVPFDPDQAGRSNPVMQPPPVLSAFPTHTYQTSDF